MNPDKIQLSEKQCDFLNEMQNNLNISSEFISVKLGKSKAWFGQIKRGRIGYIKKDDLASILSILYDIPKHDILQGGILDSFINLDFNEYQPSWFENEIFDDYHKYTSDEIHQKIEKCIEEIKHNLSSYSSLKEQYIALKAFETTLNNLNYSFELTSLICSLKLDNLRYTIQEYDDSFKRRILMIYEELEMLSLSKDGLGFSYVHYSCEKISPIIDTTIEAINTAKNKLNNLYFRTNDKDLQLQYNIAADKVNNLIKKYLFSNLCLHKISATCYDIDKIYSDDMAILFELSKVMRKHKRNVELGIDYISNDSLSTSI